MINNRSDKRVLIACEMLKDEILSVIESTGYDGDVVWLARGLHEKPEELRTALQEEILKRQDYDTVMLGYGLCGNGITGVSSPGSRLVVPCFDDCIRMLLSTSPGEPISSDPRSLYYTEGWTQTEECFLTEGNSIEGRYGCEKGGRIIRKLLANYNAVTFIDTGHYNIEECRMKIRERALSCGLTCRIQKGSLRVYEKLLKGEWDEEFIIRDAGEKITAEDFSRRPPCRY